MRGRAADSAPCRALFAARSCTSLNQGIVDTIAVKLIAPFAPLHIADELGAFRPQACRLGA
eukprot:774655-Prymnesium_polylepis.1